MKVVNIRGHSVIPELVRNQGIIVDCGAHKGEFSRWARDELNGRVISFEMNPDLFKNLVPCNRISYYCYAVGDTSSTIHFRKPENKDASIVYFKDGPLESRSTKQIHLGDFLEKQRIRSVELLKLDVEGAEINILESMTDDQIQMFKQMTIEFHDFLDKGDTPFIRKTIKRLKRLGFYCFKASYHTYGDLFFVNSKFFKITWLQKLSIYLNGILIPLLFRGGRKLIRNSF